MGRLWNTVLQLIWDEVPTMVEIAIFFYILMTKFSCTGNDILELIHVQLQWVSAKNLMQ